MIDFFPCWLVEGMYTGRVFTGVPLKWQNCSCLRHLGCEVQRRPGGMLSLAPLLILRSQIAKSAGLTVLMFLLHYIEIRNSYPRKQLLLADIWGFLCWSFSTSWESGPTRRCSQLNGLFFNQHLDLLYKDPEKQAFSFFLGVDDLELFRTWL